MMNNAKTKMMVVDNTPINENNVLIENVEDYGWVCGMIVLMCGETIPSETLYGGLE